jgi:hypothetical protein
MAASCQEPAADGTCRHIGPADAGAAQKKPPKKGAYSLAGSPDQQNSREPLPGGTTSGRRRSLQPRRPDFPAAPGSAWCGSEESGLPSASRGYFNPLSSSIQGRKLIGSEAGLGSKEH